MGLVLMHQGIGLETFNRLPTRKAVHALYECANSLSIAGDLCRGRSYADHDQLFRHADALLFALPESLVEVMLQAHPRIGSRPGSDRSQAEQCSVWHPDPEIMAALHDASTGYTEQFGFGFVMWVNGAGAADVLTVIADRRHNDAETERKVVRNELARITRTRLERMLGPEGGYQNW